MKKTAEYFTEYFVKKGFCDVQNRDIYSYGFEMIISTILDFIIVIFIGSLFGKLFETIIFFVLFNICRSYTGGYHAKTHFKCKMCFVFLISSLLLIRTILIKYEILPFLFFIFFFHMIIILKFAPVKHPNKPITIETLKKCRITSIVVSIVIGVIGLILYDCLKSVSITTMLTLLSVSILILISIITERRYKNV